MLIGGTTNHIVEGMQDFDKVVWIQELEVFLGGLYPAGRRSVRDEE